MEQHYDELFVGGDLSGIQKFLYNITSHKAAASLRGRSAYLNDYLRTVFKRIIYTVTKAGDSNPQELYCSGGKFYLITLNTYDIREAIDACTRDIKQEIWRKHLGHLDINISYIAFRKDKNGYHVKGHEEETTTASGILWKYITAQFAQQKNQKFKEQLLENYDAFFNEKCDALKVSEKIKVCAVTGIESKGCVPFGDLWILQSAKEMIEEGEKISKEGKLHSFEEYATTDDGNTTKLGILRLDVDGLGSRFIKGFETIEEYRVFSEHVRIFFEEKVRTEFVKLPTSNGRNFSDYLNVIYAGGDDLFIVGRWEKVIDYAYLIRCKMKDDQIFKKEQISISGGVAIVNYKFPIAKAAELAGEAEELAKNFRNGEKNAFHFLGKTVSWDEEFDYVARQRDAFLMYVGDYGLSKSVLHKLMLYAEISEMNREQRHQGKREDFSYIWHASYHFARMMDPYKHGNKPHRQEILTFLKSLRDMDMAGKQGRNLELTALAARWAELTLRDKSTTYK